MNVVVFGHPNSCVTFFVKSHVTFFLFLYRFYKKYIKLNYITKNVTWDVNDDSNRYFVHSHTIKQ